MLNQLATIDDASLKIGAIIVNAVGLVITIVLYFRNKKMQEKIAKATLLQKLHENAASHKQVVQLLEKRLNQRVAAKGQETGHSIQAFTESELADAREWLRFLEMLMLVLEGGVIKDEDIFPLFAFRIFLAVNDPDLRSTFLVEFKEGKPSPRRSFCSLYALHHRLLNYFQEKYVNDFAKILEEIHVTKQSDLSFEGYYEEGIENYVFHRWQPFERKRKKKVNPAIYDKPGWQM